MAGKPDLCFGGSRPSLPREKVVGGKKRGSGSLLRGSSILASLNGRGFIAEGRAIIRNQLCDQAVVDLRSANGSGIIQLQPIKNASSLGVLCIRHRTLTHRCINGVSR